MAPLIEADIALAINIATDRKPFPLFKMSEVGRADQNEIHSQIGKKGWVLLNARKLGTQVIYKTEKAKVPKKYAEYATYTPEEMVRLGEISHHPSPAPDIIRAVHLLKALGGEIVG